MVKNVSEDQKYINVTDRFAWKARQVFAQNDSALEEYFHLKQRSLWNNREHSEGTSLLSSLPEPWGMKDIKKAAERILLAIQKREKITVFGDYDVDGTTSCAMLKQFFADIGYPISVYIPCRMTEGYGLNVVGIEKLAQENTAVVITVDNGISAFAACEKAKELNIDVIITDHHDIPPSLPQAFAILNPKQEDCLFPYRMLAGVGVAFYLLIALRSILRQNNLRCDVNLRQYLDYVAIGTIADMAPLTGVNHTLCKIGLNVLSNHIAEKNRLGLYHLLKFSGWNETNQISSVDIGFKIGPRLNAAGRLGNALRSVDVLCTKEEDTANESAEFLHCENAERQNLEKQFTQEALAQVAKLQTIPEAIVLHKEDWHPGVVGLVATRVLDKYYRPVLILGTLNGVLKGSGRSTHAFNLFSVLNEVRDQFISFGGHFHAVGLSLEPQKLSWLTEYLSLKAKQLIHAEDKIPPLDIDGVLSFNSLTTSFLKKLEDFEPYGVENPRTRWLIGPAIVKHVKRMGKDLSQGFAKVLLVDESSEAWLTTFGKADVFEEFLANGLKLQIVVEAKLSFWKSKMQVDIRIIDYAPVINLSLF